MADSHSMLPPAPPSVTESFDNFRSAIDKLGNVKTLETRQLVHSIQETLYRIYKAQWEAMMDVKVFVNGRGGATERRWTTRIMNDLAGTDSSSSSITQLKGVVKEFKTAVLHKSFKDLHVTVTSIPTSQCQEVECLKLSLLDFKQIDIDKLAAKDDRKGYFLDQIRRALSWIVVHLREWEALGKSAEGKEHLNKAIERVRFISNLCYRTLGDRWAIIWNSHAATCQVATFQQHSLSHRGRFIPIRR